MYCTCLLALAIAQSPAVEGDTELVEVLRDAQATARAALQAGWMRGTLIREMSEGETQVAQKLDFELQWEGPNTFVKFKLIDPTRRLLGWSSDYDGSVARDYEYLVATPADLIAYNQSYRLLTISQPGGRPYHFFELSPLQSWFNCCPSEASQGRPWSEMIGPHPSMPVEPGTRFTIAREGADRVRQTRKDPSGMIFEQVHSLAQGGQVIHYETKGKRLRDVSYLEGDYTWETLPDGPIVLRGWKAKASMSGKPDQVAYTETLEVHEVDLRKRVDRALFTQAGVERLIPRKAIVLNIATREERHADGSPLLPISKVLKTEDLLPLVPVVKERGFLKEPK